MEHHSPKQYQGALMLSISEMIVVNESVVESVGGVSQC